MRASKKFAFDISLTFIASIVSMFFSFLVTILLGRYLGADNLGLYRMTSTFYMVGILIASVGIPGTMTKFTAELKEDQTRFNQLVSSGLILSLILGFLCTGVIYFSSGLLAHVFHMPELSFLLKMLSPVFPFALIAGVFLGLLNGLRKMGKHGTARIFQSALMISITAFLLSCGLGIRGAVSGIVLSSVGYCLLLAWFSRNDFTMTLQRFGTTAKKVLKFGSQILGASAINLINVRADTIFIGYFLTASAVGQYTVAVELGEFFWLIPNAVQTITYPATSEYWSRKNYRALQKMIDKSMKYTSLILLPIALGVGVFADHIVSFIFGEGFTEAVLPLRILIIGTALQGATVRAFGGSLTGAGRPDISLRLVIISASANIVLNYLLIPRFGIAGAAATTTFSLLLSTTLGLLYVRKILNVTIDMIWITKLMGITGAALVAFSLPQTGFEVDIIILASFTASLFVVLTTKEDRKYFAELVHDAFSLLRKIMR